MEAPAEIARLYSLPLEEFTPARNELAAELASAGRKEEAAAVRKLKKPSLTAWAVNRVVRDERPRVERLLELVDALKEARSATDINALAGERRELVAALTRRAGRILEEAGHPASAAALQRITHTLSAGGEEDERAALSTGTLSQDLTPAGFDALGAFGDAAVMAPPEPERDHEAEELQRLAAEAELEAARLTEEAERAEAAALRASEAASAARRQAREAREKAQRAARSAR
jgi:hypothetical protein